MTLQPQGSPALAGLLLVALLTSAGVAARECLLLAAAAVAAWRTLVLGGWPAQPQGAGAHALRCIELGVGGMVIGGLLAALAAAAWLGWWQPQHTDDGSVVRLVLLAGLGFTLLWLPHAEAAWSEAALWAGLAAASLLALALWRHDVDAAPCTLLAIVAALQLRAGWREAHEASRQWFRSDDGAA